MAKRTHGAAAPVPPLHQAHEAMQDVHILAMSELLNIQTVARLAALALANPNAGKQIPTIVAAFEHIQSIANGLQNDIDVCAERIGCAVAFVAQPNSSGVPA